jgi:valyl-tRNA synthetase
VRDTAVEAEVGVFVELVRAIRNARTEAGVEPARWLATGVAVPGGLAPAFDALRPALERLSRSRPLERHATRDALLAVDRPAANLSVVVGEIEAIVSLGEVGSASPAADRARLEKELGVAEDFLEAARARLANEGFTAKAPPAVVEGARAREAELADKVARLRDRLGR